MLSGSVCVLEGGFGEQSGPATGRERLRALVYPEPSVRVKRLLDLVGQRPQVQLDDLGVLHELASSACVGVLPLVQDVTAVADLQATAGVLFHHDD